MFKIAALLKRRPGMSVEEFKAYYENIHLPVALSGFEGKAVSHHRSYLTPMPGANGQASDGDYDVIMQMCFEDRAQFEAFAQLWQDPELQKREAESIVNFLDRSDNMMFFIEEHVTDLR